MFTAERFGGLLSYIQSKSYFILQQRTLASKNNQNNEKLPRQQVYNVGIKLKIRINNKLKGKQTFEATFVTCSPSDSNKLPSFTFQIKETKMI